MRRILLMLALVAACSFVAGAQPDYRTTTYKGPVHLPQSCRDQDLTVRQVTDDAAMGGQHLGLYAFRNNSLTACTLKGYPRFQLVNKAGRMLLHGQAINSQQLVVDEEKHRPQLVTIEAGAEAWFRVHYNSGGAGYMGKPCPTSSKVRIVAPGTTRPLLLKDKITSCKRIEVSTVRPGPVPE